MISFIFGIFLISAVFGDEYDLPKCSCPKDKIQDGSINGEIMCQFSGNNCAKKSKFNDAGCPANSETCKLELAVETTKRAAPETTVRERMPETTMPGKECKANPKMPPKNEEGMIPDGKLVYFSDVSKVPTECGEPCFSPDCYKSVPMECCKQADKSFLETASYEWFAEETCVDQYLPSENGDIKITFTGGCTAEGNFFYGEQCGGSEFGPFKKFAEDLEMDLPCEQPNERCECNAYVYTEEAGCFNVGTPPGARERYFMYVNDPVCKKKKAETTDGPRPTRDMETTDRVRPTRDMETTDRVRPTRDMETTDRVRPTEDPEACDCSYLKKDVEALKKMVERHDRALQEKDMEINDVLGGVKYMRDSMCKMKLPGDMYDTTKMPYPETTKRDYPETTRRGRPETTKRDYPETTKRDYPETTRRGRPETTRRDYPETTRRDYPETTRRDHPETTRRGRPETTRRDYPETTRRDYPETTRRGRPETTRRDYPETTRRDYPETTRRDYPETTRKERPETTRRDYPETTRRDYPETTRPGRPETTRRDYPETTRPGRPDTTKMDYPETTRPGRPDTTKMDRPETTRPGRPDTTKMDYPESTRPGRPDTTKMDYPESTRPGRPDTTKMDYPETTRPGRPDTTKMDYPKTTKMDYPESTYDYESTMERIRTTMGPASTQPAESTTAGVIETTQVWMMHATKAGEKKKCGVSSTFRAFKQRYISLADCVDKCKRDERCNYVSTERNMHCIGCKVEPHVDAPEGWEYYELFGDRRQLTETEVLRVEAASLRAELAKVRAN